MSETKTEKPQHRVTLERCAEDGRPELAQDDAETSAEDPVDAALEIADQLDWVVVSRSQAAPGDEPYEIDCDRIA
jgi:hypothetical protein